MPPPNLATTHSTPDVAVPDTSGPGADSRFVASMQLSHAHRGTTQHAWSPTSVPITNLTGPDEVFAAGDLYSTAGGLSVSREQQDPIRIAAVCLAAIVIATAAWSLVAGSTLQ